MKLWIVLVMVLMAQFGLHYFPWRMLLGRELPRLWAYTLGLLGMMGPFTAWLWERGDIEVLQTLWTVIVAAGGTVFALYGLDRYLELEKRNSEAYEREQAMSTLLRESVHEQSK